MSGWLGWLFIWGDFRGVYWIELSEGGLAGWLRFLCSQVVAPRAYRLFWDGADEYSVCLEFTGAAYGRERFEGIFDCLDCGVGCDADLLLASGMAEVLSPFVSYSSGGHAGGSD